MVLPYVITSVLVLNLCVFVHELGHWLFARWHNMPTPVFSIGFGPRRYALILGTRWGTEFRISPIPLGGYVQIGDDDDDEEDEAEKRPAAKPAIWRRATVTVAGVLFNVLFAIIILTGLNMTRGVFNGYELTVDETEDSTPKGLQVGDVIFEINGGRIESVDYLAGFDASAEVNVVLIRNGETIETTVIANENGDLGPMSVSPAASYYPEGPIDAFVDAADTTGGAFVKAGRWVVSLFEGEVSDEEKKVSGVVSFIAMGSQYARGGLASLLEWMAIINLNLAVFNLLPVPLLDGGRLMLLGLEKIRGRELSETAQSWLGGVFIVVLLGLTAWTMASDILDLAGRDWKGFALVGGVALLALWLLTDCIGIAITIKRRTEPSEGSEES
jgi:regulator of sigma E protease